MQIHSFYGHLRINPDRKIICIFSTVKGNFNKRENTNEMLKMNNWEVKF